MKRFIVADDLPIIRYAVRQLLFSAFINVYIEEASSTDELLAKTTKQQWDVVIMDIDLHGRSGIEMLHMIRQAHPKLPILVLSNHSNSHYSVRVMKAGGSGYLTKDIQPPEIIEAVNRVLLGKKYITPATAENMAFSMEHDIDHFPHDNLSDREFEIAKMLGSGQSLTSIAEKLFLSVTTISTYRARILRKLGLQSNVDLIQYASDHKMR